MPMPMESPILPDFAMDPVAPYFSNTSAGMPPVMPSMAGIGGTSGLQINDALFGNPIAMPPQMNFYHPLGMGAAAGHMSMGAAGTDGFDVVVPRPSSMASQKDEQANATEISSMMSVNGPGSATTTIEMDAIWKY